MLGKANHIHIAFDHQHIAFATYAGATLPHSIELMPFREKARLGRIQVFGLALANNTPAKPDQVATCIPYRKHDAFTKTVVARSEERRVGKECVSTCRSRWSRYP